MENKIKNLKEKLEKAEKEYDEVFSKLPPNLDWDEFNARLRPYDNKITKLNRELALIKIPNFTKIPNYGDRMTIKSFIQRVKNGVFINYDGFGKYVRDDKMSDIIIRPSDVLSKQIREDFDEIIWFNQ